MRQTDVKVFDSIELKSEIRKLRARKIDLEQERKELESAIADGEERLINLRKQSNIALVSREIEWQSDCPDSEIDSETDKRLQEMNLKLELQILNAELKKVLPSLEARALKCESQVHQIEKKSQKASEKVAKIPTTFLKTKGEIEQELEKVHNECAELRSMMNLEVEAKKLEKISICSTIKTLRKSAREADDETNNLYMQSVMAKLRLDAEESRIEFLIKEQEQLRSSINLLNRWETEAFVSAAGTIRDTINIAKLHESLAWWLPPDISLNSQRIDNILESSIFKSRKSPIRTSVNHDDFVRLCEKLLDARRADNGF